MRVPKNSAHIKVCGIFASSLFTLHLKSWNTFRKSHFTKGILLFPFKYYKLTEKAYELASEVFPYPLHIGVTETGPLIPGIIKSSLCLSNLLDKGIGNTIRISLSDDPIYEIKVAKQLLAIKGLIKMPTLISCPTCGRTQINLISYVNEIEDYLYKVNKNIKVAIMGCIVNGPGEAKEADIGVAGGNKKAVIFKKDKIIKTGDEKDIIKTLKEEIEFYLDSLDDDEMKDYAEREIEKLKGESKSSVSRKLNKEGEMDE